MTALPLTLRTLSRQITEAYHKANIPAPEREARFLLCHALELPESAILSRPEQPVDPQQAEQIRVLASRRINAEPLARIKGKKEFWGLEFALNPSTLVPRPDTETLVEAALELSPHPRCIADLGTGTGAVLLALLKEHPHACGIGTDLSHEALEMARTNARTLNLAHRAVFARMSYSAALGRRFDLIVSNPPYIPRHDISHLAPEVRDHDPHLALDGGPDGLAAYRAIADEAHGALLDSGHLILEIGSTQALSVRQIFEAKGWIYLKHWADLAGHPRVLGFRRNTTQKNSAWRLS